MRFPVFLLAFLIVFSGGTWPAAGEEGSTIVVGRFDQGTDSNGIPVGWSLEKTPGPNSKIHVEQENGFHFLHILSVDDTFGLKKEVTSFDIRKAPYLSWRWRVPRLPKGGDIRKRNTDDQSGQLYVLFPKFPTTINTRSVGYIWDTTAPAGHFGTSTAYGKMKYFVLQSGPGKLNEWIAETRNVYEDYKKLFNEEPPEAGGVLIYINSQHTHTSAECEYTDIVFSATPPKESGKTE